MVVLVVGSDRGGAGLIVGPHIVIFRPDFDDLAVDPQDIERTHRITRVVHQIASA